MAGGGVDGVGLGAVGAGAVLVFAAVKGKSVLGTVQSLIQGKSPATAAAANIITPAVPAAPGAAADGVGGGAPLTASSPAQKSYGSAAALQALWTGNGGPADTAAFAAAVAMAESGGSATVTSPNPDGGTNVGVFQLDTLGVGAGYTVAELEDPNLNTQITIMATGGGVNWQEWGDSVTAAVGYHYVPGSAVP